MEKVQAILIDPQEQTVEKVKIPNKDYKEWKKVLGITSPIEIVRLEHIGEEKYTGIIVDDEGLYKEDNRYFKLQVYTQPLAGRALIVSWDDEDESGSLIDVTYPKGGMKWMPEDFKLALEGFTYVSLDEGLH